MRTQIAYAGQRSKCPGARAQISPTSNHTRSEHREVALLCAVSALSV
jgi:hypothetical protein